MITIGPQGHCRVIERFGRPSRIQKAGINFKIPFIDKYKNVAVVWGDHTNGTGNASFMNNSHAGEFIELTEQIIDTEERECITKDNAKLRTDESYLRSRFSPQITQGSSVKHLTL